MKKLLTVFFLTTLLGGAAYANDHGKDAVEGDVVVEGDDKAHDSHHEDKASGEHEHDTHEDKDHGHDAHK